MKHNKLVRDLIPEICIKNWDTPITHIANETEFIIRLNDKLLEETREVIESTTDNEKMEELADLLEVMHAISAQVWISMKEVESVRQKKLKARGGFKKRIVLDETK